MATGPDGYIIFPDPGLTLAKVTSSTDDGAGRHVGPATPDEDNEGDLVPFMSGTPTDDTKLDLELVSAGGVYQAEYIYKPSTDPNWEHRGRHTLTWPQYPHDPFADNKVEGYGLAILVSTVYNRVLLFRYQGGSSFAWDVRYREVGAADPTSWTSATFTPERATNSVNGDLQLIDGWENPDGTLRLLVGVGDTNNVDLDLYGSTDGGLTWTRIACDLLTRWTADGPRLIERIWVDRSGDWVRLLIFQNNDGWVETLLSTDRGATWAQQTVTLPTEGSGVLYNNGDTDDPRGQVALLSADTPDGLFLCIARRATTGLGDCYVARRDGTWSHESTISIAMSTPQIRVAGCRLNGDLAVLYNNDDGTNQAWTWALYDRNDVLSQAIALGSSEDPDFGGSVKYTPGFIVMAEAGNEVIVLAACIDPDNSGTATDGTMCLTFRSRTRLSVGQYSSAADEKTWNVDGYWSTAHGGPLADAQTPWAPGVTTGTATWTADNLQLECAGSGEERTYVLDQGPPGLTLWSEGAAFGWLAKVLQGSSGSTDSAAVRVVAAVTTGTFLDFSVRMATNQVVLYDNMAAQTLAVGSANLANTWHQFLLGITNQTCQLYYNLLGDQDSWESPGSGIHTLTTGAGLITSHQALYFGIFASTAGTTVQFREMAAHELDDRNLVGFTNPTDLLGFTASPRPAYLLDGISVRWSGGGGFKGDSFSASLRYHYGLEQAFFDSPRLQYRSSSGATQTWVFDADAADGFGRWDHQGVGVFGTVDREVVAQWDNGGAALAVLTMSAEVVTGLTIASVDGNAVELASTIPELEGMAGYLQITDPADADYGRTIEITRQSGAWVHAPGVTQSLASIGFSAGTTVALYTDQAVGKLDAPVRARYLRLTMPGDGKLGGTPEEQHRLGHIVAGPVLTLDPPLAWEHSDSEAANVSVETLVNNVRVASNLGPPRRTLTGSLPGEVNGIRQQSRRLLRGLSNYGQRPLVVVPDDAAPAATALLSRFTGAHLKEDVGWKQDSSGRWREIGSLALVFEEEV